MAEEALKEKAEKAFVWGVKELDEVYPGSLQSGWLLIISGHPGSGKSTLASHICYYNVLRGNKCLYLSNQESKSKFFKLRKIMGMDFEDLGKEGFRYVKLPIITDESAVESLMELLGDQIATFKPDILVIDSITPLLTLINNRTKTRSLVQDFIYGTTEHMKILTILIDELPIIGSSVTVEDLEFVADGIILLRHEIRRGILRRILEIRKLRGAPLIYPEIPFEIYSGRGIKPLMPLRIEASMGLRPMRVYPFCCKTLQKLWEGVHPGELIVVAPALKVRLPYTPLQLTLALLASLSACKKSFTLGIISFRESPGEIAELIREAGLDALMDSLDVKSVTPTLYSLETLVDRVISYADKTRPAVLVIEGLSTLLRIHRDNRNMENVMFNLFYTLRDRGITVFTPFEWFDEEVQAFSKAYSDTLIVSGEEVDRKDKELCVITRHKVVFLDTSDLAYCLKEIGG